MNAKHECNCTNVGACVRVCGHISVYMKTLSFERCSWDHKDVRFG